jgi:uncharacterized protein (DUF2147 family)
MTNAFRFLVVSAVMATAQPSMAMDQSLTGIWKTGTDDAGGYLHVRFHPCGDKTCGDIVEAFDRDDVSQPAYEHLGRKILWDVETTQSGGFVGLVWAPDTEKTYRAKISFKGDVLKVSGCVAGGLFCRSQNWSPK